MRSRCSQFVDQRCDQSEDQLGVKNVITPINDANTIDELHYQTMKIYYTMSFRYL